MALIFYHFGTLDGLLLAVLDHTSAARLPRWREALADVGDVATLLERMRELYEEDVRLGARAGGARSSWPTAGSRSGWRPSSASRMEPWFALAEEVAARVLAGSPLLAVLSARDLAVTAVALYLGSRPWRGCAASRRRRQTLFTAGAHLAPLLGGLGARAGTGAVRPTRRRHRLNPTLEEQAWSCSLSPSSRWRGCSPRWAWSGCCARHLKRVLVDLCESEARTGFWVAVSGLAIVLTGLLAATSTLGYSDS